MILKLERIAQHSKAEPQSFPEEMGATPHLFNLRTKAQRNQDHGNPEHHTSGY
jgi:hypothetical protein